MTRIVDRLRVGVAVVTLLGAIAPGTFAQDAVTTRVMVRVVARDAKVIGSGVGGAQVRIVNAQTGEVLAEGKQEGGTGDTDLIMSTPRARGMELYDTEGTAGFLAELQLRQPTVVNISAVGPLGYPQATRSASKQMLLVPGAHIEGDGVVLELHGFIVEIVQPEPLTPLGESLEVLARVRGMCGCPIEPGGMWDSNVKQFSAVLLAGGTPVAATSLSYAGERSMFSGTVPVPEGAQGQDLELQVIVSDPGNENFGRHVIPLGQPTGSR